MASLRVVGGRGSGPARRLLGGAPVEGGGIVNGSFAPSSLRNPARRVLSGDADPARRLLGGARLDGGGMERGSLAERGRLLSGERVEAGGGIVTGLTLRNPPCRLLSGSGVEGGGIESGSFGGLLGVEPPEPAAEPAP